jgi:hypothetical protein
MQLRLLFLTKYYRIQQKEICIVKLEMIVLKQWNQPIH